MWFRGLYSFRQWVRFITFFPNNVFLLLLHVERVCKSFWKERWRVQVANLRPRHTMRQIAATRRRDRLLQHIASCDMWKSLSLRSAAQIETGLNLCDISQRQTNIIISASDLSQQQCRRGDFSPRFVASCVPALMQRVHFEVGVGVFNCQQILTKISFVIFNILV